MITFLVKHLEVSTSFYRDRLGFAVEAEEPGLFVQFDTGRQSLRLVRACESDDVFPETLQLRIGSGQIERVSDCLRLGMFRSQRITYSSGRECLETQDPDGHKILLVEER